VEAPLEARELQLRAEDSDESPRVRCPQEAQARGSTARPMKQMAHALHERRRTTPALARTGRKAG